MLQDDIQRLKLMQKFNYGNRVLEAGCSDGSVSLKIAASPKVKQVIGFDVRQSAINDSKALIKDLLKKKIISQILSKKVKFIRTTIEELPKSLGRFDSVCAYEVFEHLAPLHLWPAFLHLYQFIKPNGNFFISVPNRFPYTKYDRMKRSRWNWFDHRNFFSQISLELFLKNFFKEIRFYPLYPGEKVKDSLYLIAECRKKIL
jgi:2-polyprenyl-3-methyl-5-hydroxy-6-metoxy-1,4-benzoquinol methylase